MRARTQRLLENQNVNRAIDRVLFLGGATLLTASVGFAAVSFFVA